MTKLALISACVLALSGASTAARADHVAHNPTAAIQVVTAPSGAQPIRHQIAYTDQYGFHFDREGMLVDGHGYPILINDNGSMMVLPQ
jgi:hypothetical protein